MIKTESGDGLTYNGVSLPFHYDSCDDEDKEFIWFFDCTFLEDFGRFRTGEKISELAIEDNCKLILYRKPFNKIQEFGTKIFPVVE